MNETKKGNTVLLTVIAVATLLVAVVGATFAYFTASVAGNDTASSVVVKTAQIGTITYTNGNEVKLENAYPGATSETKTFTVAADSSATANVNYSLNWTNVTNGFVNKEDLVYTLTGANSDASNTTTTLVTKTNEVAPSANTLIGSSVLKPGETHTYSLTVKFKETGSDQNANQSKSFTGKIEVFTGDNGETYYNDANKSGTSEKPNAQ